MKRMILLVFIFLAGESVRSQNEPTDYCIQKRKFSDKEILKQFPFNRSNTIELVSFEADLNEDSIRLPYALPKIDGRVNFNKLIERKVLDKQLQGELIDILMTYNYDPKFGKSIVRRIAFCYDPRNAILFIDKSQNVLGYIEICFECLQVETEPKKMNVGDFCFEKYNMLKVFFLRAGISHGTSERTK